MSKTVIIEAGFMQPSFIAVHKDNLAKGEAAVWLVLDPKGGLWAAEGWESLNAGEARGATGQLSHGPTVWVEVYGPVTLTGAVPASS